MAWARQVIVSSQPGGAREIMGNGRLPSLVAADTASHSLLFRFPTYTSPAESPLDVTRMSKVRVPRQAIACCHRRGVERVVWIANGAVNLRLD